MTSISIIGGGRWARTIAGVLAGLPDAPGIITLHSRHNMAGIRDWIAERGLAPRVAVASEWPAFDAARPDALIVANKAAEHVAAAGPAMDAGIPVLVEKPMAIGASVVRQLHARATTSGAILAASHVMLFARYFDAFVALVAAQGHVRALEMIWEDGQADVVRGEMKSYDASVTVFDDVLPHVLPLLSHLTQQPVSATSLALDRGGAAVRIIATAGRLPVNIRLARNTFGRRRILTAVTAAGPCVLDFSTEPGTLSAPGAVSRNGDPQWESAPRPLGTMLGAFLRAVRGAGLDSRLSPDLALCSAVFADAVRTCYRDQQQAWLTSHAADGAARDYALAEISTQG